MKKITNIFNLLLGDWFKVRIITLCVGAVGERKSEWGMGNTKTNTVNTQHTDCRLTKDQKIKKKKEKEMILLYHHD